MTRPPAHLPERPPHASERLLTTSAAAQRLALTRQAVDQGLRRGRIPGFKNIDDGRLYVDAGYVEQRELREGRLASDVNDRLRHLEQQVADLRSQVQDRQAGPQAAFRDALVMVLAAVDEQEAAAKAASKAEKRLRQYQRARAEQDRHHTTAIRLYREALQTLALPATAPLLRDERAARE